MTIWSAPVDGISNLDDVIDSRDVIARIEELENGGVMSEEDHKEYKTLKKLESEGQDYAPDWEYGATLIRDSYFTDYAREMLEDCGDIPKDLPHYIHIDWERTARDIRVDYSPIDFGGVTYWVR